MGTAEGGQNQSSTQALPNPGCTWRIFETLPTAMESFAITKVAVPYLQNRNFQVVTVAKVINHRCLAGFIYRLVQEYPPKCNFLKQCNQMLISFCWDNEDEVGERKGALLFGESLGKQPCVVQSKTAL